MMWIFRSFIDNWRLLDCLDASWILFKSHGIFNVLDCYFASFFDGIVRFLFYLFFKFLVVIKFKEIKNCKQHTSSVLLVTMIFPSLLLKALCDKVLSVGDVSIYGFSFLKYSPRWCVGDVYVCEFLSPQIFNNECVLLMERPISCVFYIQ
jgi:hypothetical protein